MKDDNPVRRLMDLLDEKQYLVDIFYLLHLDEPGTTTRPPDDAPKLLVPSSIDQLFSTDSPASERFLAELVQFARPSTRTAHPNVLKAIVREIRVRYRSLRQLEQIRIIKDESDEEIIRIVQSALTNQRFFRRLPQGTKAAFNKYMTTVLTVSKQTGKAILARGRQFAQTLRDQVAQLEISSRIERMQQKKAVLGDRLLHFKIGKNEKWILVTVLSGAGFVYPPAGVAGFVLGLTDP